MDITRASEITCRSCHIELDESPFLREGEPFCCPGCAEGGPCICDYRAYHVKAGGVGDKEPVDFGEILQAYARSAGLD